MNYDNSNIFLGEHVAALNLFYREPTDEEKNIARFTLEHFIEH